MLFWVPPSSFDEVVVEMFVLLSTYNPYIPWDTEIFERAIAMLWNQIGIAFNVGIWIFSILSCIYIVIRLVSFMGQ